MKQSAAKPPCAWCNKGPRVKWRTLCRACLREREAQRDRRIARDKRGQERKHVENNLLMGAMASKPLK